MSSETNDSDNSRRVIHPDQFRDYFDYVNLIVRRSLPPSVIDSFLEYKREKLNSIVKLEKRRLTDLGKSRSLVYKYALPTTLVDGLAGSLASLVSGNILFLIPTVLFALVIFQLAYFIDRTKELDKLNLIQESRRSLLEVRRQETELLLRVW